MDTPQPRPGRRDALWATVTGALALAVYLRTLAPGLMPIMDTPVFQFVGRVLGVPHNPGYPAYVLLSYPFSYLPIGPLSYRLNLFSALLGAVTVALMFLIARRLGCGLIISLSAALALAFGGVFWSQAVIAEVYTLNAAIVAGILLAMLVWGRSLRPAPFFVAFALLAFGLGNHTTILAFMPGMALYALLVDRRFALRIRTIATVALILTLGLSQYAFILIRSRQPDAYVEVNSRAPTIGRLVEVMRGKEFADRLFPSDAREVVTGSVPWIARAVVVPELTVPGALMAAFGVLVLFRRRPAEALLVLPGSIAIVVFVANYRVTDPQVFLIPAIQVLALCAAVGAETTVRFVGSRQPRVRTMAALATLAVPVALFAMNFATNDLSRETDPQTYFDHVVAALPDRSVVIREDWLVDRMTSYKLVGDGSATGRGIYLASPDTESLRRMHAAGVPVFAFPNSARRLEYEGFDFDQAPVTPAGEGLQPFLGRLTAGTVVAIAVPGAYAGQFGARHPGLFRAIGGSADLAGRTLSNIAIVGARGSDSSALEEIADRGVVLNVLPGAEAVTVPVFVQVRADGAEAAIRVGHRDVIRTTEGGAMVVLDPDGTVRQAVVLQAAENFRLPVPRVLGTLFLHRLRGLRQVQPLTRQAWTDIKPSLDTGSLIVQIPPGVTVVCHVGNDKPLWPRVFDQSSESIAVDISVGGPSPLIDQPHAYVIRMTADGGAQDPVSVHLAFGGVPAVGVARVTSSGSPAAAAAVGLNTDGLLRRRDRATEYLGMFRDDQSQLLGSGWSPNAADEAGAYRRMTAPEARLVMPVTGDARWVRIQALATEADLVRAMTIGLRINGADLPPRQLQAGWNSYQWDLAPGEMRRGTNEVTVVVDPLGSQSVAIADIVVGGAVR